MFGGRPRLTRLFDRVSGGMIAWLIPAALLLGRARTGRSSAAQTAATPSGPRSSLWGGWLIVTGAGVLVHGRHLPRLLHGRAGSGDRRAGRGRGRGSVAAAEQSAGPGRTGRNHASPRPGRSSCSAGPPRRTAPALAGVGHRDRLPPSACWWPTGCPRRWPAVVLGLALLGAGTGPAAYAVQTAATPHQGSIVTAGPVSGSSGSAAAPVRVADLRTHRDAGVPGGRPDPGHVPGGTTQPGGTAPGGTAHGGLAAGRRDGAGVSAELAACCERRLSYRWAARDDRLAERGDLPAGHRASGDGDRRIHRQRRQPDARAVPGLRGSGRHPLLPQRRQRWRSRAADPARPRRSRPGSARTSPPPPSEAPKSTTSPPAAEPPE